MAVTIRFSSEQYNYVLGVLEEKEKDLTGELGDYLPEEPESREISEEISRLQRIIALLGGIE